MSNGTIKVDLSVYTLEELKLRQDTMLFKIDSLTKNLCKHMTDAKTSNSARAFEAIIEVNALSRSLKKIEAEIIDRTILGEDE